ncbi:MAG: M48 family metalloprotease [Acidobacteria bacterium]|nr:M48 family metalloprotease [Acidobacteriota bacterium]
MNGRWWCGALALIALVAISGACATIGPNAGDFNLISLDQEWELGQKLESDLDKQLRIVPDRAATAALTELGRRIVRETTLADRPWTFHIVQDDQVNAFNIPGGHIYVNTGLIAATDNVSELAGVMAHEISHGVARHGTEQISRAYGLNIVAGLVLGQNPETYKQILAQVAEGGALAKFSRDAEREADRLGLGYMARAGYDPNGMASMFEELLARRRGKPGTVAQFFSSHPLTEERIKTVRQLARDLPRPSAVPSGGYDRLKAVARR